MGRPARILRGFLTGLLVPGLGCLSGCEDAMSSNRSVAPPPPPASRPPSAWRQEADATVVAAGPDVEAQLASAIEETRRTQDEARMRWQRTDELHRADWAVKWAAATADGGTEYIWVLPRRWTGYRIEGVLAAAPRSDLACGKGAGDAVGFPVDELADWICRSCDGDERGGFTVTVLEEVFGPPDRPGR